MESLLRLARQDFWSAFALFGWLMRGRAYLKEAVAARVELDVALLPENEAFVVWLRQQQQSGRHLVLCTSANWRIADKIAARYQIFERVIASTAELNLKGRAKAERLVAEFGEYRYDYAGNGWEDLPVWDKARRAIIVAPGARLEGRLAHISRVERVFPGQKSRLRSWVRGLRLHQWSKNVLVFLPAATAHRLLDHDVRLASLVAFLTFGLCASGTYVLNDLADLDMDREHPIKRGRPFAAGQLSLLSGSVAAMALISLSLLLAAAALGPLFFATLAAYVVVTVWYSRNLKRIPMVDVLALAGLYAVRVIAGGAATKIIPTFWLLAFTMFIFLSLAMAKRYSELKMMMASGRTKTSGRGYTVDDAPLLQSCGVAAGYISVLVMALYVNSGMAESLYSKPEFLWFLCPLLLYWMTRIWIKTSRGQMDDDPVSFTLQDRPSLIVASVGLVLVWAAT